MPGSLFTDTRPRRRRRGAALTLVFAGVLATGAATGAFGGELTERGTAPPGTPDGGTARDAPGGAAHRTDDAKGGPAPRHGRQTGAGEKDSADALVSRSGDRWSAAYSAREYAGLKRTLDGSYVGVGVSVRQAGGGPGRGPGPAVEVDRVQRGSPAERAGIRPGDRLRSVDGTRTTGMPVTDVVALLRGSGPGSRSGAAAEPGTRVRLHLTRVSAGGPDGRADGTTEERHVTLRRTRLDTETVSVDRLRADVTRIKVSSFTKGSGDRVRDAVREKVPGGSGILLDLRGNSGGLVREAVTAASAFLDGGLVATYDDNGTQRALYARRDGGDAARPVVVLVDGGTMSAAELLAGALQDRSRAVVVGSRTFGKGSVQVPRRQDDGSVAELTVGHYTTPSGRDVEGEGLTPDLAVDPAAEATERATKVLSGLGPRS
ncbi:S41 family peptidase [Streptomyces sp. NBC_01187]|uniref:S41 family peptidase n=1 Tax=Streptomyces sp. NBC_01187 TaxID=2903766 RepID=UPI00386B57C2|nr:S41 family peptidase [Streptomyces sp. NBC_01187]